MELLDLTLATAAENLALDEALLDEAEAARLPRETLRLWESPELIVVVGRSSVVAAEVRLDACRQRRIPIFRRASGGAAIVAGPGCLMYAVILNYESRPDLRMLDQAHRLALGKVQSALDALGLPVEQLGTSDLARRGKKLSGNSLRCKRDHLLYHGTILYDFPLELAGELLLPPPRQPDYRAGRDHADFITTLPVAAAELRASLIRAWEVSGPAADWPSELVHRLAAQRYARPEWNMQR